MSKLPLKLGIAVCNALKVCEENHIIHRDIKPANLFIDGSDPFHVKLKLGDFGASRMTLGTMKTIKGTPSYIAPEVYLGQSYDCRADVYSLGITLYRYLNQGRTPFLPVTQNLYTHSQRETAFQKRIAGEPIPAPSQASKSAADVLQKACSYRMEDRYENAEAFRRALEEACGMKSEESTSVHKPVCIQWFIAVMLVCLGVGTGFFIHSTVDKGEDTYLFQMHTENVELSFLADEFVEAEADRDGNGTIIVSNRSTDPLNLTVQAITWGDVSNLRFYYLDYAEYEEDYHFTDNPFVLLDEENGRKLWKMRIQYPKPVDEAYVLRVLIDREWEDTDCYLTIHMEEPSRQIQ